LGHQLGLALAELEVCKNTHGLSGPSRIWKNLPFNKESKKISIPSEDSPAPPPAGGQSSSYSNISTLGNGASSSNSTQLTSSASMQGFSKK
jgi:hypothetical protein